MTKGLLRDIAGYEAFKNECEFFYCKDEYPGWNEKEKYGVITSMTDEEFRAKYPEIAEYMSPYILLDLEFGKIRREGINAERKAQRESKKYVSIYDFDEETEACHSELIDYQSMELADLQIELKEALEKLPEIQRKRVVDHYLKGLKLEEIAKEEGVSVAAVHYSIQIALEKLRKYFA